MRAVVNRILPGNGDAPVVIGLGSTGLSCARYYQRKGIAFTLLDSRENPPGLEQFRREFPDARLVLGALPEAVMLAAGTLVVSPGIALNDPALQSVLASDVPLCGDIDLFCAEAKAPVVGITGSNAKSTVTRLLGNMAERSGLKVAVGGNLGPPALDLLDDSVELYDLSKDLGEQRNLTSQYPQLAERLRNRLAGWRQQTNAAMPRKPGESTSGR